MFGVLLAFQAYTQTKTEPTFSFQLNEGTIEADNTENHFRIMMSKYSYNIKYPCDNIRVVKIATATYEGEPIDKVKGAQLHIVVDIVDKVTGSSTTEYWEYSSLTPICGWTMYEIK